MHHRAGDLSPTQLGESAFRGMAPLSPPWDAWPRGTSWPAAARRWFRSRRRL